MSDNVYRLGLLITLFGGFLSLNGSQFGNLESLFNSLGMFTLAIGVLIGVLGLIPTTD